MYFLQWCDFKYADTINYYISMDLFIVNGCLEWNQVSNYSIYSGPGRITSRKRGEGFLVSRKIVIGGQLARRLPGLYNIQNTIFDANRHNKFFLIFRCAKGRNLCIKIV